MPVSKSPVLIVAAALALSSIASAKDHLPIPDTSLDGGVPSAETLGRGDTIASNHASPASGSENPAALADSNTQATYATALVGTTSKLPQDVAQQSDSLDGRVLQYIALQGDKGVIYYEPLSRIHERTPLSDSAPSTDYRNVDYVANAIGFAGAEQWGRGSIGLSFAYLWSSSNIFEHQVGLPDKSTFDTADGLRMNIGVRYPTGPFMWGAVVQNAPGILWGKDYKREILPVKARVGNTYRLASGFLFSIDWERRFYAEGSNADNYVYLGTEINLSKNVIARAGMFGTDVSKPDKRHTTGGLTITAGMGAQISYGLDVFDEGTETVKRSFLSLLLPFEAVDTDTSGRRYK